MMNLLAQVFHLLLQPVSFCYTVLQLGHCIKSTQPPSLLFSSWPL